MIFPFPLILLLAGNGALGFHVRRPAVTLRMENTIRSTPSRQETFRIDAIAPHRSMRTPEIIERRVSESSFSFTDVLSTGANSLRGISDLAQKRYPRVEYAVDHISTKQVIIQKMLVQSWWILPMALSFVPIYCAIFKGTCASMPYWWPVVKMNYIRQSRDASLIIGGFLFSNIAYFISGSILLQRFPFRAVENGVLPIKPTKFSMLAVWILLAGTVSTIFHSVQALGSHAIAESLCYVDHGVAISACFYFFHTCGVPSKRVWALGIVGLAALIFTDPGYAILHSAWHFLSAAAATRWAIESHENMYG